MGCAARRRCLPSAVCSAIHPPPTPCRAGMAAWWGATVPPAGRTRASPPLCLYIATVLQTSAKTAVRPATLALQAGGATPLHEKARQGAFREFVRPPHECTARRVRFALGTAVGNSARVQVAVHVRMTLLIEPIIL
jgi:hypothetical protein